MGYHTPASEYERSACSHAGETGHGDCGRMSTLHEQALPTITVYPFHERYPGMEPLFHVSCDQHPEFGCCANERDAHLAAAAHRMEEHR